MKSATFLFTLLFSLFCTAQQPLPAEIKFEGKQKEVLKWEDAEGSHIVLLTETGEHVSKKFKHEEEGNDAELFAYHYIYDTTLKQYKQIWKVYDYVSDCPLDITAAFVNKAATYTDLNKNGIPEIWLVYKTMCAGDISPPEMKIIMYEGRKKYAIRGVCSGQMNNEIFEKGHYEFDPAFSNATPAVKEFAKGLWKKYELQKFN